MANNSEQWRPRGSGTFIKGVELPGGFEGAAVFNDFAISRDRSRFAYVGKGKRLVTADIPRSGNVKVDGYTVSRDAGRDEVTVKGKGSHVTYSADGSVQSSRRGFGFSLFDDGLSFSIGLFNLVYSESSGGSFSGLESEVSGSYDAGNVNTVRIENMVGDVEFELSRDGRIYVSGRGKEPDLAGGDLYIEGLEGIISLPPDSDLTVDAKILSGDVTGLLAHGGRISITSGEVILEVCSPLTVEARSVSSDVSVRGMISEGRGRYSPPNTTRQLKGRLSIDTTAGYISVNYAGR